MSSLIIPGFSPPFRGLELVDCDFIVEAISEKGAAILLGSQGIGLFGSLESQLGMLLCRWIGIVVEKEFRLMPFGSPVVDIMRDLLLVV